METKFEDLSICLKITYVVFWVNLGLRALEII